MTAQLPQVLVRNSFNILGLSSSSALKEIRKRSQQLLQLAKIEEVQEFDTDIGHVKDFRNESEIRLAVERVSGIQDRLKEIFFWFEDHSIESLKAFGFISKGSYQQAIDIFEKSGKTSSDWLDKKNQALALMFHAFASSSLDNFCRSLILWKLIAESDDFWKFYEKHYLLHDELGTSPSLFEEFRSFLFETLSAKAVSFYHQTKNPKAIGACFSAFGRVGKTADSEILQPVILKVKKEIEELEIIATTSQSTLLASLTRLHGCDLSLPEEWMEEIRKLLNLENIKTASKSTSYSDLVQSIIKKINNLFILLGNFEVAEYSPLIVLRNDTAEKLRSIAIDIYNQNTDAETTLLLLDQSSKLAASEAVLDKIESDKKQLQENESYKLVDAWFVKIEKLISKDQLEEGKVEFINLENELLSRRGDDSDRYHRILLLIKYCSRLIEQGHELFGKKKFGIGIVAISGLLNRETQKSAVLAFEQASEILKERLHLLDFLDPASDRLEILKTIDTISSDLKHCELTVLFDHHQSYLQTIEEAADIHPDENTRIAVRLLGVAACFSILYRRFHGITQRKMWKWIGWGTAIIFYFFVIMDNDKSEPKTSYKNSSYQTNTSHSHNLTSQEQEAIEWLDILYEDALKSLKDKGHSDQQIAQAILKKMREAGYSNVADYLIDLEKKTS